MSHRREHLESSLQRAIGELIAAGLSDPRIRGMVSVTGVKVTPDGRTATVGISVLPDSAQELTLKGLRSAAGHIHAQLGRKLRSRALPALRFELDLSLKKEARILHAIRQASEEDQRRNPESPGDTPAPRSEDQPS